MTTRFSRRNIVRLVAAGATIFSVGCGVNPVEPTHRSTREASLHDDTDPNNPPAEYCKSGWVIVNGRWKCDEA